MENDSLSNQLREVLVQVESSRTSIVKRHEKFQIAITGALRLLDGDSPLLDNLQGRPDDLKGFVVKLVTELGIETITHWESLHAKLEQIIVNMSEFHDRKS